MFKYPFNFNRCIRKKVSFFCCNNYNAVNFASVFLNAVEIKKEDLWGIECIDRCT